jgi:hypothetical protein
VLIDIIIGVGTTTEVFFVCLVCGGTEAPVFLVGWEQLADIPFLLVNDVVGKTGTVIKI